MAQSIWNKPKEKGEKKHIPKSSICPWYYMGITLAHLQITTGHPLWIFLRVNSNCYLRTLEPLQQVSVSASSSEPEEESSDDNSNCCHTTSATLSQLLSTTSSFDSGLVGAAAFAGGCMSPAFFRKNAAGVAAAPPWKSCSKASGILFWFRLSKGLKVQPVAPAWGEQLWQRERKTGAQNSLVF
jgi:hypothetical protein